MAKPKAVPMGTAACAAIIGLVDKGGVMTKESFRDMTRESCRTNELFLDRVMRPLDDHGYVEHREGSLVATEHGKAYVVSAKLVASMQVAPKYVGVVPAPRVAFPERPLDAAKHVVMQPRRDGALDYQSIPSLMGGKRVAHGGDRAE